MNIFCPQCDTLMLTAASCPGCGWQKPQAREAGKGQELWRVPLEEKIQSAPLVVDDTLFCGTSEGKVHALDVATCKSLWSFPLDEGWLPSETLACAHGILCVGTDDSRPLSSPDKALLALDATSGQEAWRVETTALRLSAPRFCIDAVYFAASTGQAYAVDAAMGEVRWSKPIPAWGPAAPAVERGLVIFGSRDRTLVALYALSGRPAWQFTIPEGASHWFPKSPTVVEDVCYVTSWNGCLYAVDVTTGEQRWCFATKRAILTAPVACDDALYFGGQDHHLYAVNRHTGELLWKRDLERRVYATPAVVDGVVYAASDSKHIYAFDAERGEPAWPEPLAVGDRVRADLATDGARLYAASRYGDLLAVAIREPQRALSPAEHEARGQWEQAAAAYALGGDFARAARLHEQKLQQPYRAAQLYRQAGEPAKAAELFVRAGKQREALPLFQELGQHQEAARLAEELGQQQEAAAAWEQAGEYVKAAEVYEKLEQPLKAADLYIQAGGPGNVLKARRLWRQAGETQKLIKSLLKHEEWAEAAALYAEAGELVRAAELYRKAGTLALAAEMWLQHGDRRQAAQAYEEAGELAQAASLYCQLMAWPKARELYQRLGDREREAKCCLAMGDKLTAAQLYEEAANRLEVQTQGREQERLAELYDKAAGLYRDEFHREAWRRCRQKVIYYRRLPDVKLVLQQREPFVLGQGNILYVYPRNEGRDLARDIHIGVRSRTEQLTGQVETYVDGMGGLTVREEPVTLNVKPLEAGKLILDVTMSYADRYGKPYDDCLEWHIDVRELEESRVTPRELIVHGTAYMGDSISIVQGDQLMPGAEKQVGDRVTIARGTPPPTLPQLPRCPHCGYAQAPGGRFCEHCGQEL